MAKVIKEEKAIKNKTYRNFMRVVKMIMAKGYDEEESKEIAHKYFDNVEYGYENSVESQVNRMLTKDEFDLEYKNHMWG